MFYAIVLVYKLCHNFISLSFPVGHLDGMINKFQGVFLWRHKILLFIYSISMCFCNGTLCWDVPRFFTIYMSKSELISFFQKKKNPFLSISPLARLTAPSSRLRNVQSAWLPAPWEFISNQLTRPLSPCFRVEWHCVRVPFSPICRVNSKSQAFLSHLFFT